MYCWIFFEMRIYIMMLTKRLIVSFYTCVYITSYCSYTCFSELSFISSFWKFFMGSYIFAFIISLCDGVHYFIWCLIIETKLKRIILLCTGTDILHTIKTKDQLCRLIQILFILSIYTLICVVISKFVGKVFNSLSHIQSFLLLWKAVKLLSLKESEIQYIYIFIYLYTHFNNT